MKTQKLMLPTLLTLLAFASLACPAAPAVAGPGKIVTIAKDFKGFDQISVGSAYQVEVVRGDSFSTTINIDENLAPYVKAQQKGNSIEIGLESNHRHDFGDTRPCVRITLPTLRAVRLSGACQGTLTGFTSGNELTVNLSGASSLTGDHTAGSTRAELSGASRLTLVGSGGKLEVRASGASRIDFTRFTSADTRIELSGASSAAVNVDGRIDAELSGASSLSYLGNATLGNLKTSGVSSVTRS